MPLCFWSTAYCAVVGGFIRALSKASNRTNTNRWIYRPITWKHRFNISYWSTDWFIISCPYFWYTKYHLAASPQYIAKYGTLDHPTELNQHKCLVYKGFEGPNRWLVRAWWRMGTLSNYPVTFFKQCREFNDSRASWHGDCFISWLANWRSFKKVT